MNQKWFGLMVVAALAARPATAQVLEFTVATNVPAGTTQLNAVTYDGLNSFVVAGANSTVLLGSFNANTALLTWQSNAVPTAGLNLQSAAISPVVVGFAPQNNFVIGGQNSQVFSSTDGVNWTARGSAFPAQAQVQVAGLARAGNGNVVAVGQTIELSHSDGTLTNWTVFQNGGALPIVSYYRGVTAVGIGSTNVVACGLFGLIIRSSDGGVTWTTAVNMQNSSFSFLAVAASDASTSQFGNTVVCVGQGGVIEVSTNSGINWNPVTSGTAVNLNAIAYTGSNFIAVGDSGTILASSDSMGTNWTTLTTPTAVNLYGVTFTRTSQSPPPMGVIVGANGTVVLAGYSPLAPSNPVGTSVCSNTLVFTNTLSASPTAAPANRGVTLDWYTANSGGSPLVNGVGTTSFNPSPLSPGNDVTTTFYAQARDLTTGAVSTNRTPVTLTVVPLPTVPAIAAQASVCAGSPLNAASGPAGAAAYAWTIANGTITGTTNTQNITYTAGAAGNVTLGLAVFNASGCSSTNSTNVTITAIPAAPTNPVGVTNCAGVLPNPALTVSVPGGVTVAWYATNSGGASVGAGTSFAPTNSTPGTFTYFAQANNATGCPSTNRTAVSLVLQDCANSLSISVTNATNVTVRWLGNLQLQKTNAPGPATNGWVTIANGVAGQTNQFPTNASPGSEQFFRLFH